MAHEPPRAFLLITDGLILQHAQQIVDFVTRNRIVSMFDHPESVVTGGLMGYLGSRAACRELRRQDRQGREGR